MSRPTLGAPRQVPAPLRILFLLFLVFVFLVAVKLVGGTFKALGKGEADALMAAIKNPFAGLSIGILATVLVQSSSATTSMIVALVSEGQMDPGVAVYAIMGCNVGTTITNTLVALGHVRYAAEFKRAFAGSTMHDFFNLIAIVLLMPLELATGFLRHSATWIAGHVYGSDVGSFESPLKTVVGSVAKPIQNLWFKTLELPHWLAATITLAIAVTFLFSALVLITRTMKAMMADRLERSLNAVLGKSGVLGILIGLVLTVSVQSSSITTSLMVPLFAAGILSLENGFPVTLGANIGTTVTAFIASLAGNVTGLMIAIVHFLFNLTATLIIYPVPAIRHIPIRLAEKLAEITIKRRTLAVFYVFFVFVVLPLAGAVLFR